MANGSGGAVDFGTSLQMQGAMTMERGLARMFSAGASETVKGAYQQSAMQKGALAAQNIRNRYFQTEFKQVLEARINPLNERLSAAKEARAAALQTTVMPVPSMLSAEQVQEKAELLGHGKQELQAVPGAPGADGSPSQEMVTQDIAAPNPALSGPELGAVEYEEILALMDPTSGAPVPFSSARGIKLWQDIESDYWGEYAAVNQELMQVMSEYKGNPYADNYAQELMNQTIKQGNVATTGQGDPMQAQQMWEDRQTYEADMEAKQQGLAAGQQQIEQGVLSRQKDEAVIEVATRDAARALESDPRFESLLGSAIADKFESGQPLTQQEKFEAASAVKQYRAGQEAQIARAAKLPDFRFNSENLKNPENWRTVITRDKHAFPKFYAQAMKGAIQDKVTDISKNLRSDSPEAHQAQVAELMKAGATPDDLALFNEGLGSRTPNLDAVIEGLASSPQAMQQANDIAFIRLLPEIERRQPQVADIIDQTIQGTIDTMRAHGLDVDEDLLWADRYRAFFESTYWELAPSYHDQQTMQDVANALDARPMMLGGMPKNLLELGLLLSRSGPLASTPEVFTASPAAAAAQEKPWWMGGKPFAKELNAIDAELAELSQTSGPARSFHWPRINELKQKREEIKAQIANPLPRLDSFAQE